MITMGNETSSMKIHSLLSADDLKDLRGNFPGGGASATPLTNLDWGAWKKAWPQERRDLVAKLIRNGDSEVVSFQAYQELAGRFVKGTTEERAKLIFKLVESKKDGIIKVSLIMLNFRIVSSS